MRRKCLLVMVLLLSAALMSSCALLPEEETFKTAPIIKTYEYNHKLKVDGITEDGEWYRIDYVTSDGTVWEAYVDASCVK